MARDPDTYHLFEASNFDAYDSGSDRYGAVLRAATERHGIEISDVLAVTQDFGLWAVARPGLIYGSLKGFLRKRPEPGRLIPWAVVGSVDEERSGPHTQRIVMRDVAGSKVAQIDFSAGGVTATPAVSDAHRRRFLEAVRAARGA